MLARLFNADPVAVPSWQSDDLRDILRHQLDAPIVFDAPLPPERHSGGLRAGPASGPAGELRLTSFRDLFNHPAPPLALLRLTKDFAKNSDAPPDGPLPSKVAIVLYYGSVLAALLRHGETISELSPDSLRDGTRWALRQDWLDPTFRSLFTEALTYLDDPPAAGSGGRVGKDLGDWGS